MQSTLLHGLTTLKKSKAGWPTLGKQKKIHPKESLEKRNNGATKELSLLRVKHEKQSRFKAASNLSGLKQTYYEQGIGAGNVLVLQIKQRETKLSIKSIVDKGQTLVNPKDSDDAFHDCYQKL